MKKSFKLSALLLSFALLLSLFLTSCLGISKETAIKLAQGNLDALFLNKHDSEYLSIVNATADDSKKDYREGLEVSAYYFSLYWGIIAEEDDLLSVVGEELFERIVSLLDKIYSHTKYTINSAEKDGQAYNLQLTVEPINIMRSAGEAYDQETYAPLNDFWAKAEDLDWMNMTDADYFAFCKEYGNIIVDLVESFLPTISHDAPESLTIRIEKVGGYMQLTENAIADFDAVALLYP